MEDVDSLQLGRMSPVFANRSQPPFKNLHVTMASSCLSLVPSSLVRPPVHWSAQEVKAWLEFCVDEFSLASVVAEQFDMNGKALLLLTRKDFMERAPHAGDVLYNVFQRLQQADGASFQCPVPCGRPAVILSSSPTDTLHLLPQSANSRPSYKPILPQPQQLPPAISIIPTTATTSSSIATGGQGSQNQMLEAAKDHFHEGASLPVATSMRSPAQSETCPSDSDSCHNDNERSPHVSDHDMECEEHLNTDSACDPSLGPEDDSVSRLLWEFIYQLLQDPKYNDLVCWESTEELTFRINSPMNLAEQWGMQKNRNNMTYEKLSRALRYYYKMHIIKKVPGKRLTYQFLQHPTKIRKGQRGARPHASRTLNPEQTVMAAASAPKLRFPSPQTVSSSSSSIETGHSGQVNQNEAHTRLQVSNSCLGNLNIMYSEVDDVSQTVRDKSLKEQAEVSQNRDLYHVYPLPDTNGSDMSEDDKTSLRKSGQISKMLHTDSSPTHGKHTFDLRTRSIDDSGHVLSSQLQHRNSPGLLSLSGPYNEPRHLSSSNGVERHHVKLLFNMERSSSVSPSSVSLTSSRNLKAQFQRSPERQSPYPPHSSQYHRIPLQRSPSPTYKNHPLPYRYGQHHSKHFHPKSSFYRTWPDEHFATGSFARDPPYRGISRTQTGQSFVKGETDPEMQEEPEDLSMKPTSKISAAALKTEGIKSEPDFSQGQGLGVRDPRGSASNSPCSPSSDSAYNSDKADGGKEGTGSE